MKIEKYYCDTEGCKNERFQGFDAYTKSTPDASGNGYENWHAHFDLCASHAVQLLKNMLDFHYEPRTRVVVPKETIEFLKLNNIKWEER